MKLIEVEYFPKVIAWAQSDLETKIASCPISKGKIKFYGDLGDLISESSWQSLCFISIEICRSAHHYINFEFSEEDEKRVLDELLPLQKAIEEASELVLTDAPRLKAIDKKIYESSAALIDMEVVYPDNGVVEWDYLFSEWSYGDYPSPSYESA